jgi:hypothetical protein
MRPNPNLVDPDAFTAPLLGLGIERAAATLPQSTAATIFTVTGGRILLFQLIGQVTTIIQAQANNTKLTAVPSVGTAVDLCTVVDINALEVGGTLMLPNNFANALTKNLAGGTFGAYGFTLVQPGSIQLNCAASSTGAIRWTAYWVPDDSGAVLAAA